MNHSEFNKKRNQFLAEIIPYVQIEKDDFLQRVANEECYEKTVYNWAIRLFDKGTSIENAITIVHRTRRIMLIHRTHNPFDYELDLTIENIHTMLSEYHTYNQLPPEKQQIVQEKIAKQFDHKARLEAIEEVLEDMNPEIKLEKESEKIKILQVTLQRIMDNIRKWNLTAYWQNKQKKAPKENDN
ncbi:hypothetical protein AB832_01285 [Flavobacteriaceae bacterium (ex Bugula neritina AB1)]|nr:hypothetical protein AB832_01285 [Flavobacteriaceae bacterium (ex Bugula neritina AB1)]